MECDVLWRKKLETAVGADVWSYRICTFKCVREICKIRTRVRWREQINPQRQNRLNSLCGGSEKKKKKKKNDDEVN